MAYNISSSYVYLKYILMKKETNTINVTKNHQTSELINSNSWKSQAELYYLIESLWWAFLRCPRGKETSSRTPICHSNNNYQISCQGGKSGSPRSESSKCVAALKKRLWITLVGDRARKRCVCVRARVCVCVFMQRQRDVMLIINNIALVGSQLGAVKVSLTQSGFLGTAAAFVC
jgi:hypothetical protein